LNEDEAQRLSGIKQVVLVSVDGLLQTDVTGFIAAHPESTLAELAGRGVQYIDAHTTTPSDSFPGLLALVTGGTPKSTGVYYDDSYDRTLFAPGSDCRGNPGTQVAYIEILAKDATQLFSPIDAANLPLAKDAGGNCKPIFPHDFVKTNTIFEVIRSAGGHTAWSDKHAAYDLVNGPSGKGVEDLFTPEINSLVKNGGTFNGVDLAGTLTKCDGVTNSLPLAMVTDYTTCEPSVLAYDDLKVQAILNQIDGQTSGGERAAPVPTIMGMNFQGVSVAKKLPVGGYTDGRGTPSALLAGAIAHVDDSLARIVSELKTKKRLDSTLIVVSAKHGQSPMDRNRLVMEKGGQGNASATDPIGYVNMADPNVDEARAAFVNPNSGSSPATRGHLQADDVGILWLQDQSAKNIAAVVAQLIDPAHRAAIFATTLPPGTIFSSNINFGPELASLFGDPTSSDPVAAARAPNVFIQPNWGVIYSGSSKKVSEHGGATLDDTNVTLLVSNPSLHHKTVARHVGTQQVAPTILRALGLEPSALEAVRIEGTAVLPGLTF
jgi:hypothetical protein